MTDSPFKTYGLPCRRYLKRCPQALWGANAELFRTCALRAGSLKAAPSGMYGVAGWALRAVLSVGVRCDGFPGMQQCLRQQYAERRENLQPVFVAIAGSLRAQNAFVCRCVRGRWRERRNWSDGEALSHPPGPCAGTRYQRWFNP